MIEIWTNCGTPLVNSTKHLIKILISFPDVRAMIEKIKPKVTLKKRDKNEISRVTKDAFKTLGRISIIKSISNIYLIKSILDDLASLFFWSIFAI